MKLVVAIAILALACVAWAQPNQIVGANVGFCQSCGPQVAGGVYYAKALTSNAHPTYSFSLVNIDRVVINSWRPLNLQVMTTPETGVAQQVTKFGPFDVLAIGTAGLALDQTNKGLSYGGGTLAITSIGRGWMAGVYLRVAKQTISADVAWRVGVTLAIGAK